MKKLFLTFLITLLMCFPVLASNTSMFIWVPSGHVVADRVRTYHGPLYINWQMLPIVVYSLKPQSLYLGNSPLKNKQKSIEVVTRDAQIVNCHLKVEFYFEEEGLPGFHSRVGEHYKERILTPTARASIRRVAGQLSIQDLFFANHDLIQKWDYANSPQRKKNLQASRLNVEQALLNEMRTGMKDYNIKVDKVSITLVEFSPVFIKKLDQKFEALCEAERIQKILEKEKQ